MVFYALGEGKRGEKVLIGIQPILYPWLQAFKINKQFEIYIWKPKALKLLPITQREHAKMF